MYMTQNGKNLTETKIHGVHLSLEQPQCLCVYPKDIKTHITITEQTFTIDLSQMHQILGNRQNT